MTALPIHSTTNYNQVASWIWYVLENRVYWSNMEHLLQLPPDSYFHGQMENYEALIHDDDVAHFRQVLTEVRQSATPRIMTDKVVV